MRFRVELVNLERGLRAHLHRRNLVQLLGAENAGIPCLFLCQGCLLVRAHSVFRLMLDLHNDGLVILIIVQLLERFSRVRI